MPVLVFETSTCTHPVSPPLILTLYAVVDPVLQMPLACAPPAGACSRKSRQAGIVVDVVEIVVMVEDEEEDE